MAKTKQVKLKTEELDYISSILAAQEVRLEVASSLSSSKKLQEESKFVQSLGKKLVAA